MPDTGTADTGTPAALDLEAYLARVGLGSAPPATRDGLATLQQAHMAAIPFENLDVVLRRPIGLDLGSLQAKLVAARRGGYCFEQNSLLQAVLERLGFAVTPLAARVRAGATVVRPRTHMLLRVDLPEGPQVVDVGFGADGPVRPLPLVEARETWLHGFGHRLRREGEAWVLEGSSQGTWGDLYAFTLERQHPVDYEMANHFTSTYPRSHFLSSLTAQRSWPERRVVLRNRDLERRVEGRVDAETIRDADHLLAVLEADFGLRFPAGTRFPVPVF